MEIICLSSPTIKSAFIRFHQRHLRQKVLHFDFLPDFLCALCVLCGEVLVLGKAAVPAIVVPIPSAGLNFSA